MGHATRHAIPQAHVTHNEHEIPQDLLSLEYSRLTHAGVVSLRCWAACAIAWRVCVCVCVCGVEQLVVLRVHAIPQAAQHHTQTHTHTHTRHAIAQAAQNLSDMTPAWMRHDSHSYIWDMWDMTHVNMRHDSKSHEPKHATPQAAQHHRDIRETWLPFICGTWLKKSQTKPHNCQRHDIFIYETGLEASRTKTNNTTKSHESEHTTPQRVTNQSTQHFKLLNAAVTWLIHVWDTTLIFIYEICETWLMYTRHDS